MRAWCRIRVALAIAKDLRLDSSFEIVNVEGSRSSAVPGRLRIRPGAARAGA